MIDEKRLRRGSKGNRREVDKVVGQERKKGTKLRVSRD